MRHTFAPPRIASMRNIIRQKTAITLTNRAAQSPENVQACMKRIDGEEPPSAIQLKVVRVPSQPQGETINAALPTSHRERQTHSFNLRFQHYLTLSDAWEPLVSFTYFFSAPTGGFVTYLQLLQFQLLIVDVAASLTATHPRRRHSSESP